MPWCEGTRRTSRGSRTMSFERLLLFGSIVSSVLIDLRLYRHGRSHVCERCSKALISPEPASHIDRPIELFNSITDLASPLPRAATSPSPCSPLRSPRPQHRETHLDKAIDRFRGQGSPQLGTQDAVRRTIDKSSTARKKKKRRRRGLTKTPSKGRRLKLNIKPARRNASVGSSLK